MVAPIIAPPEVVVEAGGAPISLEESRALGEVRVHQRLSLPTLCELVFVDPPGSLLGSASPLAPGVTLKVTARGVDEPLFLGQVTAGEHAYGPSRTREMRVRGYDLLHRLRKRQPVRAHVQVTLPDLARELVADLGLAVVASESGPLWPRLIQCRQSDLDLLREVAERSGLYFTLRRDTLHLLTLRGIGDMVPLMLGESLLEARIEINEDPACRAVSATGWDPFRVEPHEGRATVARVGRDVAAQRLVGRIGADQRTLVDESVQDPRQAEAIAQAELDFRVAQEVTFWGVAEGDPRLRPGTPVVIHGVAPSVAGRYVVTAANHIVDGSRGYISEISTAPVAPRARVTATIAALGIVTEVADPDGLGRVRASLPTYGNVETEWMSVLTAGAGVRKGFVSLPDVGDQVLVLFVSGDPARGVILGGLYGTQESPDWGVEAGAVRRYTFVTPGGQRVRLDDTLEAVRVENSAGSYVELTPGRVMLHARADLAIEAPGRSVVIRGQSIDFERA
jgi:phage baseplate assembly protein V